MSIYIFPKRGLKENLQNSRVKSVCKSQKWTKINVQNLNSAFFSAKIPSFFSTCYWNALKCENFGENVVTTKFYYFLRKRFRRFFC